MSEHRLSKSKIMSGLQCEKRLFLEVYHPEYAEVSEETKQRLVQGSDVGQVARDLVPGGILIDTGGNLKSALQQTRKLLSASKKTTLFEAAFEHQGVLVKTDLLHSNRNTGRLIEVKSSASVKPYHLQDVAIQYWVLKGAGREPKKAELAYINSAFVYPGNKDYRGLFSQVDMTDEVRGMQREVGKWVKRFKEVLGKEMPTIKAGDQCQDPFECPYIHYCTAGTKFPEYPVTLLPRGGTIAKKLIDMGINDLRQVREDQLTNPLHRKIWRATMSSKPEIDPAVSKDIRKHTYPRYYLDFETIQFAVPIWAGTRPYQQIPFQYSCHKENPDGSIEHKEYLETSGDLPVKWLAEELIAEAGTKGPIFVYGAFEQMVLNGISKMLPRLAPKIRRIQSRLVDLLAVARRSYYHPDMKGSWSIKAVLPTIAPELNYDDLDVQHGGMAQEAYLEAIDAATTAIRRGEIRKNLLEYCGRDTEGLIAIAKFFAQADKR